MNSSQKHFMRGYEEIFYKMYLILLQIKIDKHLIRYKIHYKTGILICIIAF